MKNAPIEMARFPGYFQPLSRQPAFSGWLRKSQQSIEIVQELIIQKEFVSWLNHSPPVRFPQTRKSG